ncbi:nucleotidyltransferase family protein [Corticibacter populi]|uniref:Nucleotidyltransferase family protein n=2 Tax=Corticibacter populi TaxID=1550736 RepID=A0A3M6QSL6_9BURK|nr:nucleotidyltransferase family protein [Corticibacter populi]RZS31022.1 molybdenum cofactor cytidylyltransferase [Corticibacter populi]
MVHVIVVAGGAARRFQASGGAGNKLDAWLAGRPVLQHVLDAARASGLPVVLVRPPGGSPGLGDSIAQGVAQCRHAAGWLVVLGDMPLVSASLIVEVATCLVHRRTDVVVPVCAGRRGHPVGFPAHCRDDLLRLTGDVGARALVRQAERQGRLHALAVADAAIHQDVDTVTDLARLEGLLTGSGHSDE